MITRPRRSGRFAELDRLIDAEESANTHKRPKAADTHKGPRIGTAARCVVCREMLPSKMAALTHCPKPQNRTGIFVLPRRNSLTPRGLELLRNLCDPKIAGEGWREIARRMGLSTGTIKVYVSRLYLLLGLTGQPGATRSLILFAIANREVLGIDLPKPEDAGPGLVTGNR